MIKATSHLDRSSRIADLAEALEASAASVVASRIVAGIVIGAAVSVAAFAVVDEILSQFTVAVFTIVGGAIGRASGRQRALQLKLEAQRVRLLDEIARNTGGGSCSRRAAAPLHAQAGGSSQARPMTASAKVPPRQLHHAVSRTSSRSRSSSRTRLGAIMRLYRRMAVPSCLKSTGPRGSG